MCEIVTEREYEIQYYEIDYKKRLLITNLMNYLQDIAIRQSEDIGVGIDYLMQHDIAWVLYKWHIDMYRYPVYGEKVKVITKPYSFKKFYAYRVFEVVDLKGNVIGKAKSMWFLINIEKRRAIKIPEEMYKAFKIPKDKNDVLDIEKINEPREIHSEKVFQVRYSDIDTNKHVNNVKYVEWAIEAVPLDIVNKYVITSINTTYEKETTYGEIVKVLVEIKINENNIMCFHKVIGEDNKQLCLVQTKWEKQEKCC